AGQHPLRGQRPLAVEPPELDIPPDRLSVDDEPFPTRPAFTLESDGWTQLQDRGRRPALDPFRRGGPRAPPVHPGARPGRGGGKGHPPDEVALRRAARAVE